VSTAGAAKAYDSLFGSFGLKENPFHVSPDPRFLFSGPAYQTAIAELMFGVQTRRGLHVLTGEAGTGKTTLMRYFLQWLAERHYSSSYVFHAHLAPAELFEFVLRDFGVAIDSTKKTDLVATLHKWLLGRQAAGDTPVLIIDEAQALSIRTLSELRLLLNLENSGGKLLQIVLAGQPELVEKLHRPELSALRQRMTVHCRLPILTLEDTSEYINARLCGAGAAAPQIFPPETVQTLYSFARGIPRITNLLCERAMIDAYAEQLTVVSPAHVRKVAAEYDLDGEVAPISLIDVALPPRERVRHAVAKAAPISPVKPLVESHFAPSKTPEAYPANSTKPAVPAPVSATAPASAPVPAVWFAPAPAPAPQQPKPKEKHGKEFIVEFCLDSAQRQESPKIIDGFDWRKFRAENPFKAYWAEVARTFRKDAGALYSSVAWSMKSFARKARVSQLDVRGFYRATAPKLSSFARNLHRKSFGTLSNWLRRPINSARPRVSGPATPQVRTGKS
jgi:general secretion pathway protein A